MSTIITLKDGRREYITKEQDFAELLNKELGLEAYEYFKDAIDPEKLAESLYDLTDNEIVEKGYCSGECDKVQSTQEHFENLLKDMGELAREIYNRILDGYVVGGRRTKKEQFALDKALAILKVVDENT